MTIPPGFTPANACIPDELMRIWNVAFELGLEIGHSEALTGSTLKQTILNAKKMVALSAIKIEKSKKLDT